MTIPIRPTESGFLPLRDHGGIPLGEATTGPSFKETLAKALGDVSQIQDDARETIAAFVRGDPNVELHELMAASEEASLSLELLVEMRNKLTEAYRTIMNMQT